MADKCPLGEDCDLTLAYMMGAEKAKDTIVVLKRENERLRAALKEVNVGEGWAALIARAALEGK